jgi:hypothetical protein
MTSGAKPTPATLQEDELFYDGFAKLKGLHCGPSEAAVESFIGSTLYSDVAPGQLIALLMTVGRRTDSLNDKIEALLASNDTLVRQNETIINQNQAMNKIMQGILDTAKDTKKPETDSATQGNVDVSVGMELLAGAMEKMTTSFNTSM